MNEITIFDGSLSIARFGDKKLDELTQGIGAAMAPLGSIYQAAQEAKEAFYKAAAPYFGEIKRDKLYEKGGFKSFDLYAAETFGINRSMAYMLANVGIHFWLDDNEYTRKARETFTVSNLAELLKADRVALAASIDSGELDENTSQEALRAYEDEHLTHKEAAKRKEKVLPTFDLYDMPRKDKDKPICTGVLKDDFGLAIAQYATGDDEPTPFEIVGIVLDGDKASAAKHFIAYTPAGACRMFEYRPHVLTKVKKAHKDSSGEPFDLDAYLAKLDPAKAAAVRAALQ